MDKNSSLCRASILVVFWDGFQEFLESAFVVHMKILVGIFELDLLRMHAFSKSLYNNSLLLCFLNPSKTLHSFIFL